MGTKNIIGELTINGSKVLTAAAMKTIVLLSSEWTNNEQTASVEGATADNNILVSASGDPTAYAEAGIYCSAQADGSLTFKCTTTPTEDILVSVYIGGSISGENEITVDEGMSDKSTNPVQNKVIKAYVDEKAGGGGGKLYQHTISIDVGGVDNMGGTDLPAKAMFTVVSNSSTLITNVGSLKKYMTTPEDGISYLEGTICIGPLFYTAPCYLQIFVSPELVIDGALGVTYLASHDGVKLANNEEIYGGDMTGKFPRFDGKALVENDAAAVDAYTVTDIVTEIGAAGGSVGGSKLYRHTLTVTFDFLSVIGLFGVSGLNIDASYETVKFVVSINSSAPNPYSELTDLPTVYDTDAGYMIPINNGSYLVLLYSNGAGHGGSGTISNITYAISDGQVIVMIDGTISDANDEIAPYTLIARNPSISFTDVVTEIGSAGGSANGGVVSSGNCVEAVDTLPTPTSELLGKAYLDKKTGKHYVVGYEKQQWAIGQPVGNKIYFNTELNPLNYTSVAGNNRILAVGDFSTNNYYQLVLIDFFEVQQVTGMGHCYVVAMGTPDMSSILGVPYIYCDVLNVEQFNTNVGADFGIQITEFGWQYAEIDASSIANWNVSENNCELIFGNIAYKGKTPATKELPTTKEEQLAQSVGGICKHDLLYTLTIEGRSFRLNMTLYLGTTTPILSFAQLNTLLVAQSLFRSQNGIPSVHEAFLYGQGAGVAKVYYVFPDYYTHETEDAEICYLTGVTDGATAVTNCRLDTWNTSSNLDYYIEDGAATLTDTVTAL